MRFYTSMAARRFSSSYCNHHSEHMLHLINESQVVQWEYRSMTRYPCATGTPQSTKIGSLAEISLGLECSSICQPFSRWMASSPV